MKTKGKEAQKISYPAPTLGGRLSSQDLTSPSHTAIYFRHTSAGYLLESDVLLCLNTHMNTDTHLTDHPSASPHASNRGWQCPLLLG